MHDCLRYPVFSARSAALGELAKRALIEEVELTPKPGLVDQHNTGSHSDLTISLMKRSALCLAPYFAQMAELGEQQSISVSMREALGLLGRHAESAMMAETQGVNTHRGAIWALGLLSAAAASLPMCTDANAICQRAGQIALLTDRHTPATFSQGKKPRIDMAFMAQNSRHNRLFRPSLSMHSRLYGTAVYKVSLKIRHSSMRCYPLPPTSAIRVS
ncbi:triphosphoribosyl-dephospho-CoA synthase [Vibrio sp. PP-XX7]